MINNKRAKSEIVDGLDVIITAPMIETRSKAIIIKNEFHIITHDGNKHLNYNPNTQKVQMLHDSTAK